MPLYQRRQFSGLGDGVFPDQYAPPFTDPSLVDSGPPATVFNDAVTGDAVVPTYDPQTSSWYDNQSGADLYITANGGITTDETKGTLYNPAMSPTDTAVLSNTWPGTVRTQPSVAAQLAPSVASQISSIFASIKGALTPKAGAAGTYAQGAAPRVSVPTPGSVQNYLPWVLAGFAGVLILRGRR